MNASDAAGCTALTWASLNGHGEVVRLLLQLGKAHPDGARNMESAEAHQSAMVITPLLAAIYSGHAEIVEALLDNGAGINARAGPGKGKSPVMLAAWTRRQNIVRLLVKRGAVVDPDVKEWLKKGAICLKRLGIEVIAWSGNYGNMESSPIMTRSRTSVGSMQNVDTRVRGRDGSAKTEMTQADLEDISAMEELIETALAEAEQQAEAARSSSGPTESDGDSLPVVKPRKNAGRRRGNTGFRQGLNLEVIAHRSIHCCK